MSDDFKVRKIAYTVPISCCVLGTCEPGGHPAPATAPWLVRVRSRLNYWWWRNRPHIHRGPCELQEGWE